MAWRIEYDTGAEKDLSKLDRQVAQRIVKFLG
jgi:mRNA-degrading endonuclease RelE of RelBE toxin-antitoxin system